MGEKGLSRMEAAGTAKAHWPIAWQDSVLVVSIVEED